MNRILVLAVCFSLWHGAARADNVTLPDVNSDEGLIARLLIVESLHPNRTGYEAAEVKKGMQAMKAVVDNRLKNHPGQFGAPNAKSYVDIVGAPNQFQGFSKDAHGKIVLSAPIQANLNEVVKTANMGKPGKYTAFVQNAIDVARAPVSDPFKDVKKVGNQETRGGTYAWKQAGSPDPGGNFVAIPAAQGGVFAHTKFYALKK